MIPNSYRPLMESNANRAAAMAGVRFLRDLWDYDADAYTFIGTRRGERWRDHPIIGDRKAQCAAVLAAHPSDRFDIYFCPNAFSQPRRKRAYALPSAYAWCDIDDADPDGYDPKPNILWRTSPGRFQGIWIWRDVADGHIAERYSRNIWAKDGGDKGGWSVTKMLRLPGSVNHKPSYNRPVVTLRGYDGRPQRLPASLKAVAERPTSKPSTNTLAASGDDAKHIMRLYRRQMGLPAGALMTAPRVLRTDRSAAVFLIVAGMIDAGAADAEIITVLLVNPYFLDKWGYDSDKAEEEVTRIRARIGGAR